MSTSLTVYNLTKRTGHYLDRAAWLDANDDQLLSSGALSQCVRVSLKDAKYDANDRAVAWLGELLAWVEPACCYVVVRGNYFASFMLEFEN